MASDEKPTAQNYDFSTLAPRAGDASMKRAAGHPPWDFRFQIPEWESHSRVRGYYKASICASHGIVRELQGKCVAANSMPDHVHLLLWLLPGLAIAEALRIVKTNSSRWVHQKSGHRGLAWQTGYGAFSVSQSNASSVVKYIREQEKHHQRVAFQEEFISFLKKNGIRYDERYIWE